VLFQASSWGWLRWASVSLALVYGLTEAGKALVLWGAYMEPHDHAMQKAEQKIDAAQGAWGAWCHEIDVLASS
jgi:hypothetical protein